MSLILLSAVPPITAAWAWDSGRYGPGLTVRRFRRHFDLHELPASLVLHVSADSRYRLLVNGELLGRGPAKGTPDQYHLDSYELAPHLRDGGNVLAVEVRWFGLNSPMSEVHTAQPGLLVSAPTLSALDTPGAWRVAPDESVTPDTTSYHDNAQQFLNHLDVVDFRRRDDGEWTALNFDDRDWPCVERSEPPPQSGAPWGVADLRTLLPRDVPALPEEPRRFVRTIRAHAVAPHHFGSTPEPWIVPAGGGDSIILDAGEMTTGFPVLNFQGGRDREVRITYAEAMGHWSGEGSARTWTKARRDDLTGEPHGYRDTLHLSGRGDTFEPFHWRTFWFVKIEIQPGPAACKLTDATYRHCVFPQTLVANFASSDPDSAAILSTSWRTLRLCAHETYEDCPYYEQLNYIADARLQALAGFYLANETRLARRCLRLFRDSQRPDGLIGSRVPSRQPQVIPFFCLHWIFMLEDYWRWQGARDRDFVHSCLPVMDRILVFFRDRLRDDGFVGPVPRWNMVDRHPEWARGEPPAILAGASTYLTCLFLSGLETAIRLHDQAGAPEDAARWRPLVERIRPAIARHAWDARRRVFLEGPARYADRISHHTQTAAILADAIQDDEAAQLAARLWAMPEPVCAQFMQSYYVTRALENTGNYGLFHRRVLDPWRQMLSQGTSTWWEYPDPTRSDCHAWGSWVAADFLSTVLGIQPGRPGWTEIRLAPQFEGLDWARGSMISPAGPIAVAWQRDGGQVTVHAETPIGVPVDLCLPDNEVRRFADGGRIDVTLVPPPPVAGSALT